MDAKQKFIEKFQRDERMKWTSILFDMATILVDRGMASPQRVEPFLRCAVPALERPTSAFVSMTRAIELINEGLHPDSQRIDRAELEALLFRLKIWNCPNYTEEMMIPGPERVTIGGSHLVLIRKDIDYLREKWIVYSRGGIG